jgi:protein farnesyltransferase subunit beta
MLGGEAHGGFTFCGVAALSLLGRLQELDIARLTFWLGRRQCEYGGFNGRTNKLLDSCYSFWVGAIFNIINNYFQNRISYNGHFIYSESNLQKYVLFLCQDSEGGLFDKPSKTRDIYHTCYSLSGLSLSQ